MGYGGHPSASCVPFRRGSRWCSCVPKSAIPRLNKKKNSPNRPSLEAGIYIRRSEELLEQDIHSPGHLGHEEVLAQPVQQAVLFPHPLRLLAHPEVLRRGSLGRRVSSLLLLLLVECRRGEHPRGHHERGGRGRSSSQLAPGQHRDGESGRHCCCRRDLSLARRLAGWPEATGLVVSSISEGREARDVFGDAGQGSFASSVGTECLVASALLRDYIARPVIGRRLLVTWHVILNCYNDASCWVLMSSPANTILGN